MGAVAGNMGRAYASGVLIAPNLFLTAHHAVAQKMEDEIVVRLDYQKKAQELYHGHAIKVVRIVEECANLDYAILELDISMQPFYAIPLQFEQCGGITMFIHHSNGGPKVVSVHATIEPQYHQLYYESYHDTAKGSSGGPYFSPSQKIFGLHLLNDKGSTVVRWIKNIYDNSKILQMLYDVTGVYVSQTALTMYAVQLPLQLSDFAYMHLNKIERVEKPQDFEKKYPLPSKPPNFYSRHHIIPTGDMGFLWFMGEENKSIKPLLKDISCEKQETIESVEWSLWNLFIGPRNRPKNKFNGDPEGNNMEPICPRSYPSNLWKEIVKLYDQIHKCWNARQEVSSAIFYSEKFSHEKEIKAIESNRAVNLRNMRCKRNKNTKTVEALKKTYFSEQRLLFESLTQIKDMIQRYKITSPHAYNETDWYQSSDGMYLLEK